MADDQLQPGDVFISITPELSGDDPHFHIVVVKTIDDHVLVVYTTKQIDKARLRCQKKEQIKFDHIDPDTLVVINNVHCAALNLESAIDCNKVVLKHQDFFINKSAFRKCAPIRVPSVIDQIKQGIKSSPIVEERIKNVL